MLLRPEALWDGREREGGMPLYNRLKEHRARLGVNQAELGKLAGGVQADDQPYRGGDYSPSVSLALKLAAICGTDCGGYFTYEDE